MFMFTTSIANNSCFATFKDRQQMFQNCRRNSVCWGQRGS